MDDQSPTPTTQYQPVTVDVPEDRIAEFHAFFGRFLAGPTGRERRERRRRHHHGGHGRGCAHRREATEQVEAPGQAPRTTEV